MEKIFKILVFSLIITMITGCGAQVKKDKEPAEELIEELVDESELRSVDIRDKDVVYAFIENTYPGSYTRDDFELWETNYMDITKDGRDELVFSTKYGDGKLNQFIFISSDEEELKIIPSDIIFEKYQNDIELDGDFILVTQKTGGSSIHYTTMGIYIYDGEKILDTGLNLVLEDVFAAPDGYETIGEIEGKLTDFVHTLTKTDLATEKTSVEEQRRYIYNIENMNFDVKEISDNKPDQIQEQTQLSLAMTKEDIINHFGEDYIFESYTNEMNDSTMSVLKYKDIEFEFEHYTEIASLDSIPALIMIKTNKYKYNYDVNIGDSALQAISKCEKTFDNALNYHGEENEKLPDWFIYKEYNKSGEIIAHEYTLAFRYNTGERYFSKDEISDDVIIESIMLLGTIN